MADQPETKGKRRLKKCTRCCYETDRIIEGVVCFPCYYTPLAIATEPLALHVNRVANMIMDHAEIMRGKADG